MYYLETEDREQMEKLRKRNVCAVCGGWLNKFLGEDGRIFLACHEWTRSHHEGITRKKYGNKYTKKEENKCQLKI